MDVHVKHLQEIIKRAHSYQGTAFIEILQNCNIFNDGAWEHVAPRAIRDEATIDLQHGQPLRFGKDLDKGIRMNGWRPEVVKIENGDTSGLLTWDESLDDPTLATTFALIREQTGMPVPIGVFRAVPEPTYERAVHDQVQNAVAKKGPGDLHSLLYSGEIWEVQSV
jgi:2-oxoglutarate ferredoxin oxidoreductase subunit beta